MAEAEAVGCRSSETRADRGTGGRSRWTRLQAPPHLGERWAPRHAPTRLSAERRSTKHACPRRLGVRVSTRHHRAEWAASELSPASEERFPSLAHGRHADFSDFLLRSDDSLCDSARQAFASSELSRSTSSESSVLRSGGLEHGEPDPSCSPPWWRAAACLQPQTGLLPTTRLLWMQVKQRGTCCIAGEAEVSTSWKSPSSTRNEA